jgi:hypothetical protein
MKHIPFAAWPLDERQAVLDALARSGTAPRQVCISRLEPVSSDAATLPTCALVTAPGWVRAYQGADWLVDLEHDLAARHPAAAQQPPQ